MKRTSILVTLCLLFWVFQIHARAQEAQEKTGKPKLVLEKDVFDAGEVYKSAEGLKHDFVIKNTGTADLQILSATPG